MCHFLTQKIMWHSQMNLHYITVVPGGLPRSEWSEHNQGEKQSKHVWSGFTVDRLTQNSNAEFFQGIKKKRSSFWFLYVLTALQFFSELITNSLINLKISIASWHLGPALDVMVCTTAEPQTWSCLLLVADTTVCAVHFSLTWRRYNSASHMIGLCGAILIIIRFSHYLSKNWCSGFCWNYSEHILKFYRRRNNIQRYLHRLLPSLNIHTHINPRLNAISS